jgi:PTS system galactitol-specific IIA component
MISDKLQNDLVVLDLLVSSKEEALKAVGEALIKAGYAKDNYVEGLIKREKDFPTGLDMGGCGVAIPHTDASYVLKPGLAFGVLKIPVTFTAMGTDDEYVEARLICAMAIDDPNAHLDMVEEILNLLRDKSALESLAKAKNPEEFISIIRSKEEPSK